MEAAFVLPLFVFCMIAALQYCQVMETAVKLGSGLSNTGKSMAAAAYLYEHPEESQGPGVAVSALSAVFAQRQAEKAAGDTSCVKNMNMALSSFLEKDQMIDLVLTYQIKSPLRIVKLPGNFFIHRASVRAWTGRSVEAEGDGQAGEVNDTDTVYVTATGSVYHEDPECTHLKLSIREVDSESLKSLRNEGGGKYHACEICGDAAGGNVYITNQGNRYHSSLSCSGLKRTVTEISREEAEKMRGCTKCCR